MTMVMSQESITATKAKATLLALLDEVQRTGRSITVTKHGKPVADITPHVHEAPYDLAATTRQLVSDEELIAPLPEWDWISETDPLYHPE